MANPLAVTAADLLRRPGTERTIDLACSTDELGLHDERFEAGAEVAVRLHLESLTDGVVADGSIDAPWVGTCRRCLQPAAGVQHIEVHELYQPVVVDPDAFPIDGDLLDLAPMVREAVLLDAPVNPLCRADCAGLCPTCGADRNVESCLCEPPPADDRWHALEGLRGLLGDER